MTTALGSSANHAGLTSAKQRTRQLREHIVQVAVAMLAADGIGEFTTRKVAEKARTSPPAVYELFGDKAGLVREVFFEGFRLLADRFGRLRESDDPRADLLRAVQVFRIFAGTTRCWPRSCSPGRSPTSIPARPS